MYHYTECGLDNIYLVNGFEVHQTPFGEAVSVHNIEGLHDAIAQTLMEKVGDLTGSEFKFLRVRMDLSQAALGDIFNVSEQTIRGHERKDKIDAVYSHLMKVVAQEYYKGQSRIMSLIERAKAKHDRSDQDVISFEEVDEGWLKAA